MTGPEGSGGELPSATVGTSPLLAAVAVAREHGVEVEQAEVLQEGSNLVLRIGSSTTASRRRGTRVGTPVRVEFVARVATGTAEWRPGGEGMARELALAGALAGAGAPVVAPSDLLPLGPHIRDGFTLGFWEHVAPVARPLDAYAAGRALRECHEALARGAGGGAAGGGPAAARGAAALRPWAVLDEAVAIAARLAADGDLDAVDATLLRERGAQVRERVERLALPLQPIHGDAHLRNVLDDAARGPLWSDWEDAFLGPRAWDLACLYAALPPFGDHDPAAAGQAYRGYGEPVHADVLRALVAARRFQIVVWSAALARGRPERRARFERWMAQLRRNVASENH